MNRPIPASRYLEFFNEQREALKDSLQIIADVLLVEKIKFPEPKTASGIILVERGNQLGTLTADRPNFYRVLQPGAGYFNDETKEDIPLDSRPGDIILVGSVSVKLFSSFPLLEAYEPDTLGITRETDIQMRFRGEDAFIQFLSDLNTAAKAKVEQPKQ